MNHFLAIFDKAEMLGCHLNGVDILDLIMQLNMTMALPRKPIKV